jgi:hypothetical protein
LYRGLSQSPMAVVAPISGTGAALIPVLVGLATGEEPSLVAKGQGACEQAGSEPGCPVCDPGGPCPVQ